MAKAKAKENKQCPVCKMEVDSKAETCPGCAAVFDDSPQGATPPAPKGGPDATLQEQAEAGDVDAQAALAEKESETP